MDDVNVNFNPYINDIYGIVIAAIKKYLQGVQTCIPAIVKKVVSRDTVIVTPAVQQVNSKWESVDWADIKLPVHSPCGGGVLLSIPLSAGDTGWIIAGDLDPSLFFKDKSRPQRQNTFNRHEYQFGFFVPDGIGGYEISSDDDGCWVIKSKEGSSKVVIGNEKIDVINGNSKVSVENDTLKIKSDSVIIETTDGASVTIDGKDWKTHKHDVTAGIGQVTVNTSTGQNTSPLTWTSDGVK